MILNRFFWPLLTPFWPFLAIFDPIWGYIGAFGTKIGSFWGDLGPFLGRSGSFCGHLRIILASFWHHFGSFWCRFDPLWGVFGPFLRRFWAVFGPFSGPFWTILAFLGYLCPFFLAILARRGYKGCYNWSKGLKNQSKKKADVSEMVQKPCSIVSKNVQNRVTVLAVYIPVSIHFFLDPTPQKKDRILA